MWVYWPLAALGFPPEMFLTSMAINLLYQFWIHTELIHRMGPLEWVLNTPSHHRVHHGRNPEYIDRNHAGVFIVWDRLFGTFQEEGGRPTYGVTRPTDTFNPVHAQWKPVAQLWMDLRSIPGIWDKLRFLFAPPGWYPESVGGVQTAPTISGHERKFDPRPGRHMVWMLMFRFGALLGMSLLVLEAAKRVTSGELALLLAWIFAALCATGEMWNKGWGRGRLALALVVDAAMAPALCLALDLPAENAYLAVLPAALSAALTAWALSASRRR